MSEALKKELIFYGTYHSDAINKLIHAVCVPLLLWTGMAMLVPLHLTTIQMCSECELNLTVSHAVTGIYMLYYLYLHPVVGGITSVVLLAMVHTAHLFWEWGVGCPMLLLAVTHAVAWVAQFIGHGKFEGRRPALFDSLIQALLTAPFFVFFEYCFFFGMFPQLHAEIQREVFKAIQQKRE